ncbi:glycerate kinase family protein [Actinomycetospora lemnae]|uniref:Glycerate kinase n=1 Tax=Actinomycetospora lemnae TaxID=3019891 RepID=A0ABT5SZM9_9PSEU|nr:glycerate kinase [Actinomycetospora sp. DW7H6]MDD7968181.1 glycerate kinase [Actinomycetospora sp. DW7H6]
MRVLFAPDSFGGSLTAAEAATAMAEGWARAVPGDTTVLLPLADGGTGFVEVLHTARGGTRHDLEVTGPLGGRTTATWLELDEPGDGAERSSTTTTAYVESASACGLHLVGERTPATAAAATSRGVGELVAAAIATGPRGLVVGLGGSACTDGGAGMLAALGAVPRDGAGTALADGGGALATVAALDGLGPVRERLAGVDLVVAADVDHVLTGPEGAAAVFGPQKGADADTVAALDAALTTWGAVLGEACGRPDLAGQHGAGAAGGLGAALLALGARRVPGGELVRDVAGLDAALDRADLVVTGEGRLDGQSLHGKLVSVVAARAREHGVPCIALAGQVDMSSGEALEAGLEGTYSVAADAGSVEAALAEPGARLADLAEGVARRWGARPA